MIALLIALFVAVALVAANSGSGALDALEREHDAGW